MAKKTPLSQAQVDRAQRYAEATIEDLILRLQVMQRIMPGARIIMSHDGEGNDYSPLYNISAGVYVQRNLGRGDIRSLEEDESDDALNAVVLYPIS